MGTYSTYKGRVGDIYDEVVATLNDLKTGDASKFFPPAEFLIAINRCRADLASFGYWQTVGTIDLVADQESYNLLTLFPNLVSVNKLILADEGSELYTLPGVEQLAVARKLVDSTTDAVKGYYIMSNTLYIVDAPHTSETAGLIIYYSYLPPKMGGGVEITLGTAVTNIGSGTVGIAATAHGLEADEEIVISGTTNYNGTFTVLSTSTTDVIHITDTYVSETLSASAKCGRYYTPKIPRNLDGVFADYAICVALLKDSGRKSGLYNVAVNRYETSKKRLLAQGTGEQRMTLRPVR